MSGVTNWDPPAELVVDWYDPDNWDNGVPDEDKIAVVNRLGVSAKAVAVKGLNVQGNGHVDVERLTAEEVRVAEQGELVATRVTVSQELTLSGGSLRAFEGADVPQGATLRVTGPGDKEFNGPLRVHGTGVWTSSGRLILSNEGLELDGVLEVDSDATLFHPSAVVLRKSGRIKIAPGCTLTIDGPSLSTAGLVELADSTLDLRDGDHALRPGARVSGSGRVRLASGSCHAASYHVGCTTRGSGALALGPDVALVVARGDDPNVDHILYGPLTLARGRLELEGGVLDGKFDVGPGARLLVAGDAPKSLHGRLRLRGAGALGPNCRLSLAGEGLHVLGTLEVQAPAVLACPSAVAVGGDGRLKIAAGSRLTIDGPSLVLSGRVELDGSTLDLRDGDHALRRGARVSGSGTVTLAPGSCHSDGYSVGCQLTGGGALALDPEVTLMVCPGDAGQRVTVFGPLSLAHGRLEWAGGSLIGEFKLARAVGLLISGSTPRDLNGRLLLRGEGELKCPASIELSNQGLEIRGTLRVTEGAMLAGAATVLNAGRLELQAPLMLRGPLLQNDGVLDAAAARIDLADGWHTFGAAGTLRLLAPDAASAATPRVSGGEVALAGALELTLGFEPDEGDPVQVVAYETREGEFAVVEGCPWYWRADYGDHALAVRPASPPVPYVAGSPGEAAQRAFERMSSADPAEQRQRIAEYVERYGFEPQRGLKSPSIRDPRLGLTIEDLWAADRVTTALGVDPAVVLAVWTSEGRHPHRGFLHGAWNRLLEVTAGDVASVSEDQLRAYARSCVLFNVFGCDPMTAYRRVPGQDNELEGLAADHETPFVARVNDLHAAGLPLAGVADADDLSRYFRQFGLRLRYRSDGTPEIALARCAAASWLALQAALFELQRHAVEDLFESQYGVPTDLGERPWVTYIVWNTGSTWDGGSEGFVRYLTKDDHGRPYTSAEEAIGRRFGAPGVAPEHLSSAQLALYYGEGGSRSALANSVVVKYLIESYAPWWTRRELHAGV